MKWPQMSLDVTKWHVKFQIFFWGDTPNPPHERGDTPLSYSPPGVPMARKLAFGQLGKCFIFNLGKTLQCTDICVPLRSCMEVDLFWQALKNHPVQNPQKLQLEVNISEHSQDPYVLLIIPVTSAGVECANSAIKLVKMAMWSAMHWDRLNGLLLMYVHRDIEVNYDWAIDSYAQKHPRRMLFLNPLLSVTVTAWHEHWVPMHIQWMLADREWLVDSDNPAHTKRLTRMYMI